MKREDVVRLRELLAKATPGPWQWSENGNILGHMPDGYDETREVCAVYTNDEVTGAPNAPLIIEAINALPALLALAEAVMDAPEREVRLCCGHFAVSDDDGTDTDVELLEGKRVRLVAAPEGE